MVSCSSLISRKRVELIIEALGGITGVNIEWTHIGTGPQKDHLENLAQKTLSIHKNIKFKFKGHLENREVYLFYKKSNIDLFINVSSSEGIPVSMMEALSFSIPIIATNVGGVSELVSSNNGFLLNPNPTPEEIRQAIYKFHELSMESRLALRQQAYDTWKNKFNAETNYTSFIEDILRL